MVLPAAQPSYVSGLKQGWAFSWRSLLAGELLVSIPGVDVEQAQSLADQAHQVCPYSNATRGNIDVTVTVVED